MYETGTRDFMDIKDSLRQPSYYSIGLDEKGYKYECKYEQSSDLPLLSVSNLILKVVYVVCKLKEVQNSYELIYNSISNLEQKEWNSIYNSCICAYRTLFFLCGGDVFHFIKEMSEKIVYSIDDNIRIENMYMKLGIIINKEDDWDAKTSNILKVLARNHEVLVTDYGELIEKFQRSKEEAVEKFRNMLSYIEIEEVMRFLYNTKRQGFISIDYACMHKTNMHYSDFKELCDRITVRDNAIIIESDKAFYMIKQGLIFIMKMLNMRGAIMTWEDIEQKERGICKIQPKYMGGYITMMSK